MKSIPIEALTPEVIKRWYIKLVNNGVDHMNEDIAQVERECFVKDAIQEQEQRKGQMQSKPGHFVFNLHKPMDTRQAEETGEEVEE